MKKTDSETIKDWYGVDIPEGSVVFFDTITDWSWGAVLVIFTCNGKFFVNDSFDEWIPVEVSEDEAIQLILEFSESVQEIQMKWD